MSTSGSSNFNLTGTLIIREALELIGVVGAADVVSSEDQDDKSVAGGRNCFVEKC